MSFELDTIASSGLACFPAGEGDPESVTIGDVAGRPLDSGFVGEAKVSSEGERSEFFEIVPGNTGVVMVERFKTGAGVETSCDRIGCWSRVLTPAEERRGNGSGWTPLKAVGAAIAGLGEAVRLHAADCVETDALEAGPGRPASDGGGRC